MRFTYLRRLGARSRRDIPNVPETWTVCRFTASSLTPHRNCVFAIFSQSRDANPDWHQTLQSPPWPEHTSAPNSWPRLAVQDNYQELAYTSYMRQFRFERTAQRASLAIARLLRVTRPARCRNSLKNVRALRYSIDSQSKGKRSGHNFGEAMRSSPSRLQPPRSQWQFRPTLCRVRDSTFSNTNSRTSVQVVTYDARAKGLWPNQFPDSR